MTTSDAIHCVIELEVLDPPEPIYVDYEEFRKELGLHTNADGKVHIGLRYLGGNLQYSLDGERWEDVPTVKRTLPLRWYIGPAATRLQFFDGESWEDVPTVHYGKEVSQRFEVGP